MWFVTPPPICAGAVPCSLFCSLEERAGSWLLCVRPLQCVRIGKRDTAGKISSPSRHEMNTGSSCLKQLQLFPWQTTFPAQAYLVMHTFQTCIVRKQSAQWPGAIPSVAEAHGMARAGGTFLWSLLGHCEQAFLLLVFRGESPSTLCLYSLLQKLRMDKLVGVSPLSSHNEPTGVVGRVNWWKQQLYSLSYHTWGAMWSIRKSVRNLSVAFGEFWTIPFLLMLITLVREWLYKWKNNSFSIFALFMSSHWLTLVFTDMGGLVASFSFVFSYL